MEGARETVRRYYELLCQWEYAQAYRLLSPRCQEQHPAAAFLTACLAIESVQVASITRGSDADRLAVSALLTSVDGRSAWVSGEWQLVQDGDTWLLDADYTEQSPFERPDPRMERYSLVRWLLTRGRQPRPYPAARPGPRAADAMIEQDTPRAA